jgi:uncharacterized membrane protein
MVGGFVGALAAAIPGLIDYSSLASRHVKRTATIHMSINLVVVALYAVNIWLRTHGASPAGLTLGLSVICVAALAVSGWLGGHMVHVKGVSVASAPEPGEAPAAERARPQPAASPVRH